MIQLWRARLTRTVVAGAVMAGGAVGLAASASADDNCDPFMLSMTPQPVLSCQAPDVAPPPDQAQPAVAPVPPPVEPGPFGEVQAPALPVPDGSIG
jgi:hypothetical protein